MLFPRLQRTWDQLEREVLPLLAQLRAAFPGVTPAQRPLDDPCLASPATTIDTFAYVFGVVKRAVFVMVRGGGVRLCVAIDSAEMRNEWGSHIVAPSTVRRTRPPRDAKWVVLEDKCRWFANGGAVVDTWDLPPAECEVGGCGVWWCLHM
jgi:hypothetical protein